jgi:type I restriction enzyme S subunit
LPIWDFAGSDRVTEFHKQTEIGEIPEDWDVSTLGLICEQDGGFIQTGPFGSQLHANEYEADGVPVINPTHLEGDRINHSDVPRVSLETSRRLNRHRVEAGDILFGRRGELGRHGLVSEAESGWLCGTGCFLVRVRHPKVDNAFLSYLFSTRNVVEWLTAHAAGTIMPNLNNTVLSNLPVVLPSIAEQRSLVAILNDLRQAIEIQSAICAKLAALKPATMAKLFREGLRGEPQKEAEFGLVPHSWMITQIKDAYEVQLGKMLSQKARIGESPKPYLRNKNIQWGYVDMSDLLAMDFDERETTKFRLVPGDLLVCEGGIIGRAAIWRGELTECYYQKALHRIRPRNRSATNEFLCYWLSFSFEHQNIYSIGGASSTIAHLPQVVLEGLRIPLPPEDEQREIVEILSAIDASLDLHRRKLALREELFGALLPQLMNGSIGVKDLAPVEIANA